MTISARTQSATAYPFGQLEVLQNQLINPLLGIRVVPNSIFLAEPYDVARGERETAIGEALKGYSLETAHEEITNLHILHKIMWQILQSQYGLAEITELRPNVILELGILYGMNKPTLLLVRKGRRFQETLGRFARPFRGRRSRLRQMPSNLAGIEYVHYSNYLDLKTKLTNALRNLFGAWRKQMWQLDAEAFFASMVKQFELQISAKELMEKGLAARIVKFTEFEGEKAAVIDKGELSGIREGLQCQILSVDSTGVEEPVGRLSVIHVQPNLSVADYEPSEPGHRFWTGAFGEEKIRGSQHLPEHVVRPLLVEQFKGVSIKSLRSRLEKYRAVLKIMEA